MLPRAHHSRRQGFCQCSRTEALCGEDSLTILWELPHFLQCVCLPQRETPHAPLLGGLTNSVLFGAPVLLTRQICGGQPGLRTITFLTQRNRSDQYGPSARPSGEDSSLTPHPTSLFLWPALPLEAHVTGVDPSRSPSLCLLD